MKPRGRRPGDEDTRARILNVAREQFAHSGYERASMRSIAGQAQVDPALITHYFGSSGAADRGLATSRRSRGGAGVGGPREPIRWEALVRAMVGAWETPVVRQHFLGMLRTAASHEVARGSDATDSA